MPIYSFVVKVQTNESVNTQVLQEVVEGSICFTSNLANDDLRETACQLADVEKLIESKKL